MLPDFFIFKNVLRNFVLTAAAVVRPTPTFP
jgi:hypothetical protein